MRFPWQGLHVLEASVRSRGPAPPGRGQAPTGPPHAVGLSRFLV